VTEVDEFMGIVGVYGHIELASRLICVEVANTITLYRAAGIRKFVLIAATWLALSELLAHPPV
jgi:hypothetical protein